MRLQSTAGAVAYGGEGTVCVRGADHLRGQHVVAEHVPEVLLMAGSDNQGERCVTSTDTCRLTSIHRDINFGLMGPQRA